MADFSNPALGPKPKIPKTVPLDQADPARRELYAPLKDIGSLSEASEDVPSVPLPSEEAAPAPVDPEIAVEDRQAFLASILGLKPYEKSYTLYGQIQVTYRDRTPRLVERIQSEVNAKSNNLDDVSLAIYEEQLILAAQLLSLHTGHVGGLKSFDPTDFVQRIDDLMNYPKPLYQALLDGCREFDRHVAALTQRALQPDFWPVGTENSQSPRTEPARSTSRVTAAATPIGR